MTAPISAARTGGFSFRLAGIPVTIHFSFLLIIAVLGFQFRGFDRLLVWVGVATVAVLLHEIGHAVVGRIAGRSPQIDLAGFGGVTSWPGGGNHGTSRGWSLAISLAGPGLGFVGGGAALGLGAPCCSIPGGGDLPTFASAVWLFTSFGWGLLNLLPILPLDGGQAIREVLPGTPAQRRQRAAVIGVVTGVTLAAVALIEGQTFLALLAGWITYTNVQQVRSTAQGADSAVAELTAAQEMAAAGDVDAAILRAAAVARGSAPPKLRQAAVSLVIKWLHGAGRPGQAWALVRDPRLDVELATELLGQHLATHPDHAAIDTIVQEWAHEADDRRARGLAVVVLAMHGQGDDILSLVRSGPVDAPVAVLAQSRLHVDGAHATAAELGWYLLAMAPTPLHSPVLAYNTGCAFARAGQADAGIRALKLALQLGFADLQQAREDPELATLHDHPAWKELVQADESPEA